MDMKRWLESIAAPSWRPWGTDNVHRGDENWHLTSLSLRIKTSLSQQPISVPTAASIQSHSSS